MWTAVDRQGVIFYQCRPCGDLRERRAHHAKQHEETATHREAVEHWQRESEHSDAEADTNSPRPTQHQSVTEDTIFTDALRSLLWSASNNQDLPLYPPGHPDLPSFANPEQHVPSPVTNIDWGVYQASGNTIAESTVLEDAYAHIAEATLSFLNSGAGANSDLSDDDAAERSSDSSGDGMLHICRTDCVIGIQHRLMTSQDTAAHSDEEAGYNEGAPAQKRARNHQADTKTAREWFPWSDMIVSDLQVRFQRLTHLDRLVHLM